MHSFDGEVSDGTLRPRPAAMPGRIQKAPEHHMDDAFHAKARTARRSFMGKALAMGAGAASTATASANPLGEDAIL